MAKTATTEEGFDRVYGPEGLVARRSWDLVAGPRSVMLKGLFGFPWRDREVQAKCTQRDYAGTADIFGTVRVDRHHPVVPAEGCTCGIYATIEPGEPWGMRRYLARRVLVHGFVRLSGRVLFDGARYRAERARIEGPLVVAVPGPGRLLARLAGTGRLTPRVSQDGDRYRVSYVPAVLGSWGGAGMPLSEWHQMVADRLALKYGVRVEGFESTATSGSVV